MLWLGLGNRLLAIAARALPTDQPRRMVGGCRVSAGRAVGGWTNSRQDGRAHSITPRAGHHEQVAVVERTSSGRRSSSEQLTHARPASCMHTQHQGGKQARSAFRRQGQQARCRSHQLFRRRFFRQVHRNSHFHRNSRCRLHSHRYLRSHLIFRRRRCCRCCPSFRLPRRHLRRRRSARDSRRSVYRSRSRSSTLNAPSGGRLRAATMRRWTG